MPNYELTSLPEQLLEEWYLHCGTIFPVGVEYFRRHYVRDPRSRLDGIFIVRSGGWIVSTVRVFDRDVYLGGRKVGMGGIGEVSTHPDHREQGLSSRLLQSAVDYMADKYEISMLGTGLFHHYGKHGWQQSPTFTKAVEVTPAQAPAGCAVAIVSEPDGALLDTLSVLYDRYAPDLNCAVTRSRRYFHEWVAAELALLREGGNGALAVLSRGGVPVAYAVLRYDGIAEYIGERRADYVDALLTALAGFKPDAPLTSVKLPRDLPTSFKVTDEDTYKGWMVRLNRPFALPGGARVETTEQLVGYIAAHGGCGICGVDDF